MASPGIKILDNYLWITGELLMDYGVSQNTIWKNTNRYRYNELKSWQNYTTGKTVWIRFDTIPAQTEDKIKKEYLRRKGWKDEADFNIQDALTQDALNKELNEAEEQVRTIMRKITAAHNDAGHYINQGISTGRAQSMAQAAALLRLVSRIKSRNDVQQMEITGVEKKGDLIDVILRITNKDKPEGLRYSNQRAFLRRLKEWNEALQDGEDKALNILISKKLNNHNSQKRTPEAENLLLALYADNKIMRSIPNIVDEYNALADGDKKPVDKNTGEILKYSYLPQLSTLTIRRFLNQSWVQHVVSKQRYGTKFDRDFLRPYVKRKKPQYSLSLTSSDGEVAPFKLRINGQPTHKRATCYLVFDVRSGAIIGWSLAKSENIEVMRAAFKDMLLKLEGVKPYQNQLDNFGKGMQKDLEQIFPNVHFCEPYNAQSKYAERYIGQFEQEIIRHYPGWQGSNISDRRKKDNKPNPDIEGTCYTFTELNQMYAEAITKWNNKVVENGKTRWQLQQENRLDGLDYMDDITLVSLFGEHTWNTINRRYVRLERNGEDLYFEIPNYSKVISQLRTNSIRVRYMPHRSDKVWLFEPGETLEDDRYICEAHYTEGPQVAEAEQTEDDKKKMGRAKNEMEQYDKWRDESVSNIPSIEVIEDEDGYDKQAEAESLLNEGYTNKEDMNEAVEIIENGQSKQNKSNIDLYDAGEEGEIIDWSN